jgi:hypothetical protein
MTSSTPQGTHKSVVERPTLVEKLTAFGGCHPWLNAHARALVDEAIARIEELEAEHLVLEQRIQRAEHWFRKARSTLSPEGEG